MRTISSTEAKTTFNALIAEVQRTGQSVTVTTHGEPAVVVSPARPAPRAFGWLKLEIPDDFDEPLGGDDLASWHGEL